MSNSTFGAKVEIFVAGSPGAYVEIKGATNITNPRLQMADPISSLTNDMTSGIPELVHSKTYQWAPGSCDIEQIPADAGQVALIAAAAGTALAKFKFTRVGVTPVIVNAFVRIEDGDNPSESPTAQTLSATFLPSGVSPVS
jgi:hypothetical protein